MDMRKCLYISVLLLVVLLAVSFLALFLNKRLKESSDREERPKTKEEYELELKRLEEAKENLDRIQEEELAKARENLKKIHGQYSEELRENLGKQTQAQVEAFAKHHEKLHHKPEAKRKDLGPGPLVDLILDKNLPAIGRETYTTGLHEIQVIKEETFIKGVAKFTHSLPGNVFTVDRVFIGGKAYPVPRTEGVLFLTSIALVSDPGFPYYITIYGSGDKPIMYENMGREFVKAEGVMVFENIMEQKAVEFGRKPRPARKSEDGPIFNMTANEEFEFGDKKMKVIQGTDMGDVCDTVTYHMEGEKFTVRDVVSRGKHQIGLPNGAEWTSVKVYYHKNLPGVPLLVKFTNGDVEKHFLSGAGEDWNLVVPSEVIKMVENLNKKVTNPEIVINVARRTDYFRNGTGEAVDEKNKEVIVYVLPDTPLNGWTTYRHQLEPLGVPIGFKMLKAVYGGNTVLDLPDIMCDDAEVYTMADKLRTMPPLISLQPSIEPERWFFVLKDNKYEADPSINEDNLAERLAALTPQSSP